MSSCRCRFLEDCVIVQGSPRLPYICQRLGDLNLDYNTCHIRRSAWLKSTDVCTPSLVVILNKVIWRVFWKDFRRSCGLPMRSVGPINRSAGLLVGRTHLSGTAVRRSVGTHGYPGLTSPERGVGATTLERS
jgi:hypothetical protein